MPVKVNLCQESGGWGEVGARGQEMLVGGVEGGQGKPPGNSLEHIKLEHDRDVGGGQGKPPGNTLARKKYFFLQN